nr:MAG TPA: hypothetical protein [Caudoviricetes sp.]
MRINLEKYFTFYYLVLNFLFLLCKFIYYFCEIQNKNI